MVTNESLILIVMSYLLTGVALTGYDFSAPPFDSKFYVIKKNYKVAVAIWFAWPVSAFLDAKMERQCGRSFFRYMFAVFSVAIGMFLWARVVYFVVLIIIHVKIIGFLITGVTMLLASPLITAIAMPSYNKRHSMIEITKNYVSAKEEEKPRKGLFELIGFMLVFLVIFIGIIAFLTYLAD